MMRKSGMMHLAAMIGGLVVVGSVLADGQRDSAGVSEQDFIGELPVVLSVSRLSQPLADAPGSVTIIDREMIRMSGARDVSDLFRLVPGFNVARPPQASPVVVYHGLTETFPRRMQVLVDGRSQYQPFEFGGINWNMIQVALDDIERIEVVRGSNSAAYGSNAFLGVANIITRSGAQVPALTVSTGSGDDGIRDRLFRLAHSGDRHALRVTVTDDRDQGLAQFRDNRDRNGVDARLDYRLDARNELVLRYGDQETEAQIGFAGSRTNPERLERKTQQYFQADWHRNLASDSDLSLRFFRVREDLHNAIRIVTAGDADLLRQYGNIVVPVDYGSSATRNDIEIQHTFTPSASTRLVWGGGWREDSVHSPHFFSTDQALHSRLWRVFGNLEWRPLDRLVINAGATYEDDSNTGPTTAPRLVASVRIAEGQTVRVGISRAYRSPSLLELKGNETFVSTAGTVVERNLVGNASNQPESLLATEIGYLGEFRSLGLSVDARAFLERVDDRIDSMLKLTPPPLCEQNAEGLTVRASSAGALCGLVASVRNVQGAEISGLEYHLDYRPVAGTRFMLGQSFVSINGVNKVGVDDFSRFPAGPRTVLSSLQRDLLTRGLVQLESSAPTHSTTLSWMQKLPWGLDLSVHYYSAGAMRWTGNTRADAWHRIDWRLAYPFAVGPTRGELAMTVQGDGRDHGEFAAAFPQSPRGFVSLRLEY